MTIHEDNLLRILISTDNHLGVWEKDEERKNDSFRAFEQVLQIAVEQNVDFLLLGGDLFHDNKPSRSTVVRAIELLNKYCLGDKLVKFEVLSDHKQNFVSGIVNFHNPNLNIGLPVFTIHGNHDDPAGQDNLSAVDLLSTCGLVNYFGKVLLSGNNIGNITLSPVLLQKGTTKLALYGLGNVRDERLGRLFQTPGCVQWLRPGGTDAIAVEDWLNVFVLHQNRVQHGATAKNCLQERHIPAFMDLVIWGHEHECIPEPQPLQAPNNADGDRAFVIQPGSTVATALSEGEAKAKHVIMLELLESQWRSIKMPLSTVRPFIWDNLVLAAQRPPLDPQDTEAINALLERKVAAMIQQANADAPHVQQQPGTTTAPLLPLIRLRVDYTGFTTVSSQRFGAKYVGKVANPHDMILWAKAPARRAKEEGKAAAAGDDELAAMAAARPDQLDQARIEDLVSANLHSRLDILPPDELALALHEFVEKDERSALAACVTTVLTETQAAALTRPRAAAEGLEGSTPAADPTAIKDDDIVSIVQQSVQNRLAHRSAAGATPSAAAAAGNPLASLTPRGGLQLTPSAGAYNADDDDLNLDARVSDMDVDGFSGDHRTATDAIPPVAPRGRGRKGAAAAAGGGLRQAGLGELFSRASQGGARGLAGRLGSSPAANSNPNASTKAGRGVGAGRGRARGTARGRGRGRKVAAVADDDVIDDSDEEEISAEGVSDSDDDVDEQPATKRAKVSRPRRAAATAADKRRRAQPTAADDNDDDEIDDSDVDMTPAPSRGGGGVAAAAAAGRHSRSKTENDGDFSDDVISADSLEGPSQMGRGGGRSAATPAGRSNTRVTGTQQTGGAGGRQRAAGRQAGGSLGALGTAGTAAAATQEDGGFIGNSDDDEPATVRQPASRPATAAAPAGGGRRRVLPSSLGNSQR